VSLDAADHIADQLHYDPYRPAGGGAIPRTRRCSIRRVRDSPRRPHPGGNTNSPRCSGTHRRIWSASRLLVMALKWRELCARIWDGTSGAQFHMELVDKACRTVGGGPPA